MQMFLQETVVAAAAALAGVLGSCAPHVVQMSGSHSRTATKHGHCLVVHCALQRQPGKRLAPDTKHFIDRRITTCVWHYRDEKTHEFDLQNLHAWTT